MIGAGGLTGALIGTFFRLNIDLIVHDRFSNFYFRCDWFCQTEIKSTSIRFRFMQDTSLRSHGNDNISAALKLKKG